MRGRSALETSLTAGRRALARTSATATAAAVAVMLVGATAAQAHDHGRSSSPQQGGDSTAFVHQIHWSSSSPVRGVTLLSGVYANANAKPFGQ